MINAIGCDADNDGLIEITKLEQLNAMRWDLNGNGDADSSGNNFTYAAAFPHPVANLGVGDGALGCSDSQGAAAPCTGYELKADLDFDDDASYADSVSNKAAGPPAPAWGPSATTPIGLRRPSTATAKPSPTCSSTGLPPTMSVCSATRICLAPSSAVGLKAVNVTGNDRVGALVGRHYGTIRHCYATGTVAGRNGVGGLVGINGWDNNQGSIYGSFAAVAVSDNEHLTRLRLRPTRHV